MTELDHIKAQPLALKILRRGKETNRIASAYLFEGPSGVGKEMTAMALATDVVAQGDEHAARRIAEGMHPDVRVFGPREDGKRNIKVEHLRSEILPLAQYAPFEASATFFIFPQADVSLPDIQPEAANALLKTLEEPKRNVHFILLSERSDRLLTTIRSRCQTVRFHRLPPDVLADILRDHGTVEDEIGPAIALSGGRADFALALTTDGAASALFALALKVDDALNDNRPGTIIDVSDEIAAHDMFLLALESLQLFYRDVAAARLGLSDSDLAFQHVAKELRERSQRVTPKAAAERVSLIGDHLRAIEENANRQVAMNALLFEMREAR